MYRMLLAAATAGAIILTVPALADDDDDRGRRGDDHHTRVSAVTHAATKAECGACHIAYPAGFLPAASWRKMMGDLDNHFGESAALDEATRADIQAYLVSHAGRGSGAPQRISELRWFVDEHRDEVSRRELARAGSWANCGECHRGAERGYFDDD